MAVVFMGFDPEGLALFRDAVGNVTRVDAASSPFARSLIQATQPQQPRDVRPPIVSPNFAIDPAPTGPNFSMGEPAHGPHGQGGNARRQRMAHMFAGPAVAAPLDATAQNQAAPTPNVGLPSFIAAGGARGTGGNVRAQRMRTGTGQGRPTQANPTIAPYTDPETPPEVTARERRMMATTRPNR